MSDRRLNVLVTGGGTIAPIDDVRCITNVSTGRFSSRISEEFLERGARVWHVYLPGAVLPVVRLARLDGALGLESGEELRARLDRAVESWERFRESLTLVPAGRGTVEDYAEAVRGVLESEPIDVAVMAAAVSDYEPAAVAGKLGSEAEELFLRLKKTPKVIRRVKEWRPGVFLVGFKLLSGASVERLIRAARESGEASGADLVVANDLEAYRAGRHTVHLVDPRDPGEPEVCGPGPDLVAEVVDRIRRRVAGRD